VQARESATYFSRPTPTLLFADRSMSAQRVRWFSEQRMTIHCSNISCLARSRRVETRPLSAGIGVGLCRMLHLDFAKFTVYALR
jgi:hypothetical protein